MAAAVVVIVTAAARCIDHKITTGTLAIVMTVVVIVGVPGDDLAAVSVWQGIDRVSRTVGGYGGRTATIRIIGDHAGRQAHAQSHAGDDEHRSGKAPRFPWF